MLIKILDFLEDDAPTPAIADSAIETPEDTEDKTTVETNQYAATNDNVTLAKSPFTAYDDKNTRIKYQLLHRYRL